MQDPIAATEALLKLDADLHLLVDGRIYGEELPCGEAKKQPRAAIVLRSAPNGIPVGGYLEHDRTGFDLFAYSDSPYKARQVFLEAKRVLKRARAQIVEETLLHSFQLVMSPRVLRDPDTKWPYVLSSWTVLAAENQAA